MPTTRCRQFVNRKVPSQPDEPSDGAIKRLSRLGLPCELRPLWSSGNDGNVIFGSADRSDYASTAPCIAVFSGLTIALTLVGVSLSVTRCAMCWIRSCGRRER
jgi:hypothetical protein